MPTSDFRIRPATQDDSASLAILNDAATRRLVSHVWGQMAAVGQSPFEVGRELIARRQEHFSHFSNWQVLECEGRLAGGFNSCRLPVLDGQAVSPGAGVPAALGPLNELKAVAGGSWYIVAISVFPEFRGRGLARPLLAQAEAQARAQGIPLLTLMVGSFNPLARRLYERVGFQEWQRRPFTPFPGSDPEGEWILMRKPLV